MTEMDATDPEAPIDDTGSDDSIAEDPATYLTDAETADLVEAEPVAAAVSYSGQDFDVAGLVRRLRSEDILIPVFGHQDQRISSAGFQRSFVWTRPQMDRFIESLLRGYPVPGIFLIRQGDRRYLVLDGQQRLRTLRYFMDGLYDGKEFSLQNVAVQFKGLTYRSLPEDTRRLLDDTFFQATIVVTDGSAESLESIYRVFERVNAGGTQLTPHEIRVALFAGPLIDYLEVLNGDTSWRHLYGKKSPRLRDQELILRILALLHVSKEYRRPLKSFLNSFAASQRYLAGIDQPVLTAQFGRAACLLSESTGREALRPGGQQLNSALTEAVFVGLMRRLAAAPQLEVAGVSGALTALAANEDLTVVTSRATADEDSVKRRLEIATSVFAGA